MKYSRHRSNQKNYQHCSCNVPFLDEKKMEEVLERGFRKEARLALEKKMPQGTFEKPDPGRFQENMVVTSAPNSATFLPGNFGNTYPVPNMLNIYGAGILPTPLPIMPASLVVMPNLGVLPGFQNSLMGRYMPLYPNYPFSHGFPK